MFVKGQGRLRHGFFGTYCCTVAIAFDTGQQAAQDAKIVLDKITPDQHWKVSENNPSALLWQGSSEQLDLVKAFFKERCKQTIPPCGGRGCRHQCRDAGIDSVNHSIDYGPVFNIEIEAAAEQTGLFP